MTHCVPSVTHYVNSLSGCRQPRWSDSRPVPRASVVPGDIWQFGASLDTLRTDTGDIDTETVTGLCGEILRNRPGLQAQTARIGVGRGGAAAGDSHKPKVGLSSLLKPHE